MNPLAILNIGGKIIDKIWPDPTKKAEAKRMLAELEQSGELQEMAIAAGVVSTEAQSEHFLVAAWRPITMLCFVAIIVNNYILVPYLSLLFDTGIELDIPPDMWELLKLGIGGYVVGRSAEKGIKAWRK